MPYGTEIQAKLGVDTSSVGTDLAGAKNVFNKWGQEVAASGATHGANLGEKLVGGIEHKIFGARHLSGALAAALGLNIESISEHIAAAIVGGSKEGWAEAGKIADEATKLIAKKFELALSPKQAADKLQHELEKTVEEVNGLKIRTAIRPDLINGGFTKVQNAEDTAKQAELNKKILEIEVQIGERKKEEKKDQKELTEEIRKSSLEELSDGHKFEALNQEIADKQLEIIKGGLTEGEIAKKKIEILKLEHDLRATLKRIQDESIREGKQDAEDQKKAQEDRLAREEKLFSLQRTRFTESKKLQEDQNKLTDRSKLTVGELANLNNGNKGFSLGKSSLDLSFGANEGLTDAQVEAKKKAQRIQELEQEAEQKRLSGDVAGSEAAFGQVGSMRDELVKSGGVKSTEGDKFGELKKQIAEDNTQVIHTLQEIAKIEKGKFVNQ